MYRSCGGVFGNGVCDIRDATLHSVSLMEEIVDLKDDELSAPQCCSMCVLPMCMHVLWPCIKGIVCVYSSHPMSPCSNVSSAPPLCSLSPQLNGVLLTLTRATLEVLNGKKNRFLLETVQF